MRLSSLLHNRHTHAYHPNFNRQEEGVELLNDKKIESFVCL